MPRDFWRSVAFTSLVALALSSPALTAHEGHDHGPKLGEAAAIGPVTLSPQARQNLGVETVEASISEIRKTTGLLARVQSLPERTARLSARIEGQVSEIYVKLGQKVRTGDALLKLTPRAIDTPAVLLRAPIDGVIMAQNASVGFPFTPETVLVEVSDLSQVLVRGVAYENADLSSIQEGTAVTVRLDFFGAETFTGHVERIPAETRPVLGPISSIMGEIMLVGLTSDAPAVNSMELRSIADWGLRQRLLSLPGISQITVIGGDVKQYQVLASPEKLRAHGVSLHDLEEAVTNTNVNSTGGFILRDYRSARGNPDQGC